MPFFLEIAKYMIEDLCDPSKGGVLNPDITARWQHMERLKWEITKPKPIGVISTLQAGIQEFQQQSGVVSALKYTGSMLYLYGSPTQRYADFMSSILDEYLAANEEEYTSSDSVAVTTLLNQHKAEIESFHGQLSAMATTGRAQISSTETFEISPGVNQIDFAINWARLKMNLMIALKQDNIPALHLKETLKWFNDIVTRFPAQKKADSERAFYSGGLDRSTKVLLTPSQLDTAMRENTVEAFIATMDEQCDAILAEINETIEANYASKTGLSGLTFNPNVIKGFIEEYQTLMKSQACLMPKPDQTIPRQEAKAADTNKTEAKATSTPTL